MQKTQLYDYELTKRFLVGGTEPLPQAFDYIWVFTELLDQLNNSKFRTQTQILISDADNEDEKSINLTDYCLLYQIWLLSKIGVYFGSRETLANKLGVSYSTVAKSLAKLKSIKYKGKPILDVNNEIVIKNGKRIMKSGKGRKGFKNDELIINPTIREEIDFCLKHLNDQKRVQIIPFLAREMGITLKQYYMLECSYIMTEGMGGISNKSYFASENGFSRQMIYLNFPKLSEKEVINPYQLRPFRQKPDTQTDYTISTTEKFTVKKDNFHSSFKMWYFWKKKNDNGDQKAAEIMQLWELRANPLEESISFTNAVSAAIFEPIEQSVKWLNTSFSFEKKIENYYDVIDELLKYSKKIKLKELSSEIERILDSLNSVASELHKLAIIRSLCFKDNYFDFSVHSQEDYINAGRRIELLETEYIQGYFEQVQTILMA